MQTFQIVVKADQEVTVYVVLKSYTCATGKSLFGITTVNSFSAKFYTTSVCSACLCYKLSVGKEFVCKVERLNVKQHRS